MVNILIPAMGESNFFKDCYYPKFMLDADGKTVLERVIENFGCIKSRHMLFILNREECNRFHVDQSIKILTEGESSILILKNRTGGALCTCMLAISQIDSDIPLIIANSDQIIDADYQDVIEHFADRGLDAGVITFPSIHPRWSYVKLEEDCVVESAEKRPLSNHAIAGFYYYRRGSDFIEAAKRVILKGNSQEGKYYISASLNELILMDKKIGCYEIEKSKYHSFYSPDNIKQYRSAKSSVGQDKETK